MALANLESCMFVEEGGGEKNPSRANPGRLVHAYYINYLEQTYPCVAGPCLILHARSRHQKEDV